MSITWRLFCMWMHRTLMLACGIVMVVGLVNGYGANSLFLLIPMAVNAAFAEAHRLLMERGR